MTPEKSDTWGVFTQLAALQNDLANAILHEVEGDPSWRHAFLHAEFRETEAGASASYNGFIVSHPAAPTRPNSTYSSALFDPLQRMHDGYRAAGQGFTTLDVVLAAPDGRYTFTFGNEPVGKRSRADEDALLAAKYAELTR